jgi:hypothetical protein
MKFWTVAGLLAGLMAISIAWKKSSPKVAIGMRSAEKRYSIDELISDQEL